MSQAEDTVLIIEDDAELNDAVASVVESLGYLPVRCFNGRQALDAIIEKNLNPLLVLCDVNMPEMNGLEFVKYQLAKNMNLNICMLTADNSSEVILQALKLGVTDYITKPFNISELSDKLSTLIEIGKTKVKLRALHNQNAELKQAGQAENMLRVINSNSSNGSEE